MSGSVRRIVELVVGAGLIAVAVIWLSGGFAERIPPDKADVFTPVPKAGAKEAVVERIMTPVAEWASGTVRSRRRTAVASRILARIEEVRVRAGDEVGEGDAVVVLDAREFKARVEQAQESLRAARAQLDLARTEKARIEKLFRRGVASRERLDERISDLRVAEAEVERLTERLNEARTALSYAVIRSPVRGRVVDRLAEPGDTAQPGQPLLRIYDPTTLRLEAPVRETLAVRLRVDQALRIEVPALSRFFEGTIEEIVPYAEPGTRTLLIKVRLPSDGRLLSGMYGRIAVPAGERARLVVPAVALERIGQLAFATVIDNEGHIERRLVTTGNYRQRGRIEVLSGLSVGERIVVAPEEQTEEQTE